MCGAAEPRLQHIAGGSPALSWRYRFRSGIIRCIQSVNGFNRFDCWGNYHLESDNQTQIYADIRIDHSDYCHQKWIGMWNSPRGLIETKVYYKILSSYRKENY